MKEWDYKNRFAFGVLIAGAGILRLGIAWLDFPKLVTQIPDDAFYYFGIARNLAAGYGVTFDGTHVTNGFHPLWLVLILPCFALFAEDQILPIRLVLSLAAGFDCGTGLIIGRLVKRLTQDKLAAWLAMFFYLFNPGVLKESINGLETSANVLLVAICFMVYLRFVRSRYAIALADWNTMGALFGLMVLARTDNSILVAVMLLAIITSRPSWRMLLPVMQMSGMVLALLSPWLVWNWLQFGSILQSSGEAYPYALRAAFFARTPYSFSYDLLVGFFHLYQWTVEYIPLYYFLWQKEWDTIYYAVLFGIIALFVYVRTPFTRHWHSQIRLLFVPVIGLLLIFAAHALIRWYPRSWYFVPLIFFAAIFLGLTFAYIRTNLAARGLSMKYVIVILLIGLGVGFPYRYIQDWDRYPWQIEMWEAAKWIKVNLPPAEKLVRLTLESLGTLRVK